MVPSSQGSQVPYRALPPSYGLETVYPPVPGRPPALIPPFFLFKLLFLYPCVKEAHVLQPISFPSKWGYNTSPLLRDSGLYRNPPGMVSGSGSPTARYNARKPAYRQKLVPFAACSIPILTAAGLICNFFFQIKFSSHKLTAQPIISAHFPKKGYKKTRQQAVRIKNIVCRFPGPTVLLSANCFYLSLYHYDLQHNNHTLPMKDLLPLLRISVLYYNRNPAKCQSRNYPGFHHAFINTGTFYIIAYTRVY